MTPDADATLVAAWERLADPGASAGGRKAAAARLYEELQALAPKALAGAAADRRDDAASVAFLKVCGARSSPDARRREDDTAASVRAYLRRALRSAFQDGYADDEAGAEDDGNEPEGEVAPETGALPLGAQQVVDHLREVVIPSLRKRRRAGRGEALEAALDEMLALRRGARDVADVVGLPTADPAFARERAAMYQRHCRARAELLAEVGRRERSGLLDPADAGELRWLLDVLRRRRGAPAPRTGGRGA